MVFPPDSQPPTPSDSEPALSQSSRKSPPTPSGWQQRLGFLPKVLRPLQNRIPQLPGWFRVRETDLAAILEKIRAELPTTEVILVGKPQAGKSSIVRGITGASVEIVGQGFRPHTLHTQRYTYPTGELPLIVFTDTVGLGESAATTAGVVEELMATLAPPVAAAPQGARILIVTIKVTDFATEALLQTIRKLRQQQPEIPCVLAVTCLHEVYPEARPNHPEYPPSYPEVERAFAALQQQFQGLFDRAVMIDFTLEADDYTPVFYGLEPLIHGIADLLPAAEATMLHQILANAEAGTQVGNLYREAGRRYILPFAVMAATLAAVPLPLATMPVLTALQVTLVGLLGQLYGQTLSPSQAGGVVSAIAGGFAAQAIGRELVKFIPGLGSVIAASWAAAYTWSLGEAACVYFGDLMGGKQPDPEQIRQVMAESLKTAQSRFRAAAFSSSESSHSSDH
jgi:uncharacterized protein (DUF697 family)/predicted GTPase